MNLPFGVLLVLYFLAEVCFTVAMKVVGDPLAVLPVSVAAASAAWAAYVATGGRWRRASLDAQVLLAAIGGSTILLSATAAYSLPRSSVMLPLFLMKAGGLWLCVVVDAAQGQRPRPRSVAVLSMAGLALVCALPSDVRADGTAAALALAGGYLAGYAAKLGPIGRRRGDEGFFLGFTTLTLLISLPAAWLLWRVLGARALPPAKLPLALVGGLASQCCGAFGGLILLRGALSADRARGLSTHAALFSLHRCAGALGVLCAAYLLHHLRGAPAVTDGEAVGAALMLGALWLGTQPVGGPRHARQTVALAASALLTISAPRADVPCGNLQCRTCYPS